MSVAREKERRPLIVCRWCGKNLGAEYFFRCPSCGATYCYIHTEKHSHK